MSFLKYNILKMKKPNIDENFFCEYVRTEQQEKLVKLVEAGKLTKEGDSYVIELSKLGYNKLLGTGSISVKLISYGK